MINYTLLINKTAPDGTVLYQGSQESVVNLAQST